MTKQIRADLMLVAVTLCWGFSYYMVDLCLAEMGNFTLNAYRFFTAFAAAMLIAFPTLRKVNRTTIKYSVYLGAVLSCVYISATYGVMYTSLSNVGFLCALAVVFTPILDFIIKKKKPESKLVAVVIISCVSIALLTLNEGLKPALGDIFCLICSFAYAVDLLLTETAVKNEKVNAFHLGVYQLAFVGVFNLILAFLFDEPAMPQSPRIWGILIFLSVFCTGFAFIAQAVAQQYTSATHVGVIFTLEPVFSGCVAFFIAGEILLPRAYVGAVLLILGILFMEIDVKKLFKKDT